MRISAHKLPIEVGRYDWKTYIERTYPLCCEGIGNKAHYIFECKNNKMIKTHTECLEPFYKNYMGWEKLSKEAFCREILSGKNDDLPYKVGLLHVE